MKAYVRPEMMIEKFVADEFVSACDDQGVTYDFVCNAGNKGTSYDVWLDDGDGVYDSGDEELTRWSTYSPCNESHSVTVPRGVSVKNVFQDGWMRKWSSSGSRQQVIVWTDNGTNIHCTANLNITEWGKNRS